MVTDFRSFMGGVGVINRTPGRQRGAAGFTFIEIMISLALIGIGIIVIIQSVNLHSEVMRKNMIKTLLYQTARMKLYEAERHMSPSSGVTEDGLYYKTETLKAEDSDYTILRAYVQKENLNAILFEVFPVVRDGKQGIR